MQSIGIKINVLNIFLALLCLVSSSSLWIWQHNQSLNQLFTQSVQIFSSLQAQQIAPLIQAEDPKLLTQNVANLSAHPDLAYVLICNAEQKLIFQRNFHALSKLPPSPCQALQEPREDYFIDPQSGFKYLKVTAPLQLKIASSQAATKVSDVLDLDNGLSQTQKLGTLHLGFSMHQLQQEQRYTLGYTCVMSLLLLLGISAYSWFFTRRLVFPIKQLIVRAYDFLGWEANQDNSESTEDELCRLNKVFNRIAIEFEKSQQHSIQAQLALEMIQPNIEIQPISEIPSPTTLPAVVNFIPQNQLLTALNQDLHTPINAVLGMLELLQHTTLNSQQHHLAHSAMRSAELLQNVMSNILDSAAIATGSLHISEFDFEIRGELESIASLMAAQAYYQGLEFILDLPNELNTLVRGDAKRLRQIIINLLGFMIKHTEAGDIYLKVSIIQKDAQALTESLEFEIFANIPEASAKHLTYLLNSDCAQHSPLTAQFDSASLGIILAKQLLQMMQSSLCFTELPSPQPCLNFSLNFTQATQIIAQRIERERLKNCQAFIVDDNTLNREILAQQLKEWGIKVQTFASGTAAVSFLQNTGEQAAHTFQFGIIDKHMPLMDGIQLAQSLARETRYATLPLIMLSSEPVILSDLQQLAPNIYGYLHKPVIQQQLLQHVFDILDQETTNLLTGVFLDDSLSKLHAKILLVEDNIINQEIALGMLYAMGCKVKLANDGNEAIEAFKASHFDAILMDCHMPVLDGFQASIAIRQLEQQQNTLQLTPIIALTADLQPGIVKKCLGVGMNDYLCKPYNSKQLHETLLKWLPLENVSKETLLSSSTALDTSSTFYQGQPLLDVEVLKSLQVLNANSVEGVLSRAVKAFQKMANEELVQMRQAFANNNATGLAKIAHNFKSAAANLGALTLSHAAQAIESQANIQDLSAIPTQLELIQAHLPLVLTSLQEYLQAHTPAINPSLSSVLTQNATLKRILLVDDDVNYRLVTHALLSASAFEVVEASNGLQALGVAKRVHPDLIILDAMMDGLDGFEVCRILRQDPNMVDIPIIMSTGLGDIESINRAFDAGATDFIVKPLNYAILIHRIGFIIRASENTLELKKSKFQLSAAQRIARLGYWTWDAVHDWFQMSEHLAKLCLLNLAEFGNTLDSFMQLIHPEDRMYVRNTIVSAGYNNWIQHTEYRIQVTPSLIIIVHQELEVITENDRLVVTGTVQDITHKKQTEKQIHRLAYYDNLTGLASRAYYHERIEAIIKMAEQRAENFSFLFLDMDGFKNINDSFGHDVGDQFLQAIALRLQNEVREVDFVARLGGDEFCIITNNIGDQEAVQELASRILMKINLPLTIGQHQINPRVSIGIAIFPKDGKTEIELMKAADAAMYYAKQSGKQRFIFYNKDMANQAINRLNFEQQLHTAFQENQFVLHYQPQISMHTGRMIGMEALIRWQHPERGLLAPGEFLPLINEFNLICELGNWVINSACMQLAAWHDAGMPYIKVAVNIEPAHFQNPELLNFVAKVLSKTAVPAQYLELEVTESAMQTEGHLEVFKKLRQIGVHIGIDDFGTGYSCLASLKQLPLDSLKIDKIFIDDVLSNQQTSVLLGTIIGLSQALNYSLIAEGVETRDQALVMYGLGCDYIQGYFFSKPVSADQIPNLSTKDFTLQSNHPYYTK